MRWLAVSMLAGLGVAAPTGCPIGAAPPAATKGPDAVATRVAALAAGADDVFIAGWELCEFTTRARVGAGLCGQHVPFEVAPMSARARGLYGHGQLPLFFCAAVPEGVPESADIVQGLCGEALAPGALPEPMAAALEGIDIHASLLTAPRFDADPRITELAGDGRAAWRAAFHEGNAPKRLPEDQEAQLRALVEAALQAVSDGLATPASVLPVPSYADAVLVARLRPLTIVAELKWPKKLKGYVQHVSEKSKVPMFWA